MTRPHSYAGPAHDRTHHPFGLPAGGPYLRVDQNAIDRADWDVFRATGVAHLMSISGLHITMIAGLFAAIVFALWRRSFFTRARLPTILPAQKAAALAGAAAALVYVLLAGFGVPAQRTLYMVAVVAAALWFGPAQEFSRYWIAGNETRMPRGVVKTFADAAWKALRTNMTHEED